jgi:integrase
MILATAASLHMLAGGLRVKVRVQHPEVKQRKDRNGWPWMFRYRNDEVQPDGSIKTLRKYHEIAPSKGEGAITKKQAEVERDKVLAKLNAPTAEVAVQQLAATGVAFFSEIARLYREGYLARQNQIARPTREKEEFYLREYLVPQWGKIRLNQIQPKAVEDWLHTTFDSWWTMHGVRAIMTRIYNYAEGHGLWEEGKRSPSSRAKLGKKRHKRERKILSFEETASVLALMDEPYKLIIEICIATGARISEVLGLKWKHVNLTAATIKIEQRVWHQEIGRPKSEDSKRTLGIGDLADRFAALAANSPNGMDEFVFQQRRAPGRPLWDSGVRDALHQDATSKVSDHTRSAAQTSRGGNKWVGALWRHRKSRVTAIWR